MSPGHSTDGLCAGARLGRSGPRVETFPLACLLFPPPFCPPRLHSEFNELLPCTWSLPGTGHTGTVISVPGAHTQSSGDTDECTDDTGPTRYYSLLRFESRRAPSTVVTFSKATA